MKIKVAMKAENHLIGSLITPLTVTRTFLGPARSLCSQSHTPWKLRDRGVEHLPGAEGHSAVTDGKGEIGTEKAGLVEKFYSKSIRHKRSWDHHLGMSRHVIGAFTGVLERNLLRDEPGQNVGRVFVQMLQRIKFAQLLAQQQQSGRLGSLPSVKYNAATQREDTHWERTTIHCITFLIPPPLQRNIKASKPKRGACRWNPPWFDVVAQSLSGRGRRGRKHRLVNRSLGQPSFPNIKICDSSHSCQSRGFRTCSTSSPCRPWRQGPNSRWWWGWRRCGATGYAWFQPERQQSKSWRRYFLPEPKNKVIFKCLSTRGFFGGPPVQINAPHRKKSN